MKWCANAPPLVVFTPVLPFLVLVALCMATLPVDATKLGLYCISLTPCFVVTAVYAVRGCDTWKEERAALTGDDSL